MEIKCPNCGKTITLSTDELNSQGNIVVCPCCLTEFVGDNSLPIEQRDTPGSNYNYGGGSANTPQTQHNTMYCRYCGSQIAVGCNFCPVCGQQLAQMPPQPPAMPATPQQQQQPAQNTTQQPISPMHMPYKPNYRYPSRAQNTRQQEKPKKASCIAYVLIVLLVIIFIWIMSH
ncbi:MAG: hypothetical protein ACI308_10510 [Muribaculaceae bacterium]